MREMAESNERGRERERERETDGFLIIHGSVTKFL